MWFYLSSGFVLGLTAGTAPGPLSTLVVSQTLAYGVKDGIKVALAPLVTDPLIVLLCFWIGAQFASSPLPLGLLSLTGAVYICYLAWKQLAAGHIEEESSKSDAASLRKGVLTNLLNPHPYMFWITVGVPFILKTWASGPWGAVLWLLIFYLMLVGSKIGLSIMVGRTKRWIRGRAYIWLNRILGIVLLFFAVRLAQDGIGLIKIAA
jgi:threonine/homoserine/homoserine lactone efflux protein